MHDVPDQSEQIIKDLTDAFQNLVLDKKIETMKLVTMHELRFAWMRSMSKDEVLSFIEKLEDQKESLELLSLCDEKIK